MATLVNVNLHYVAHWPSDGRVRWTSLVGGLSGSNGQQSHIVHARNNRFEPMKLSKYFAHTKIDQIKNNVDDIFNDSISVGVQRA